MARIENLLAAQALALTDRINTATADGVPDSVSERAALVTLLAHPGRPVSWLGDVLSLTSSGITRLLDRMQAAGWVTRTAGADTRSRQLTLSAQGRRVAQRILALREAAMQEVSQQLSAADRRALEPILGRLVAGLADDRPAALRVCRLCDRAACAERTQCPLEHTSVGVA